MKSLTLASLLVMAAWAFGCGGPDAASPSTVTTPSPTPTSVPIDPEKLLSDSGRVMRDLETFHFFMTHERGGTLLMPGLLVEEVEGDVAKPDGLAVQFSGVLAGFAVKASVVTMGDDRFMTNPLTGAWERLSAEVSPLGFFDPREGISSMMTRVSQVLLQEGDGRVYRLGGVLPAEALAPLVGTTVKDTLVDVELTVESGSLHLLEVRFSGRVTPTEPDGTIRRIKLSRFGEPVTIEPPL